MMRGCPVTGRLMHFFDKVTHRCVCGRWERGFKPKVEKVRPRAECQICAGEQALEANGCLGHHGYKRPGCGFIEGDCMGVGHKPFPAYDVLERYLAFLQGHAERIRLRLMELPTLTSVEYHYEVKREKQCRIIRQGDDYQYDAAVRHSFPSFADVIERKTRELERESTSVSREIKRVEDRIALARLTLSKSDV